MQDMSEDDLQALILTSREVNSRNAALTFFNLIIITSMKMKSRDYQLCHTWEHMT